MPVPGSSEARRASLADRVRALGSVGLSQLASDYGVSEMTIRRDLALLESAGIAKRVRGGAEFIGPELFERRLAESSRAKTKIAAKLEDLVPASGAIVFDASSTIYYLAATLQGADITVVSSGQAAFNVLQGRAGISTILTGGAIEPETGSLVGPFAERTIEGLVFARAFISASFVHPHYGATDATIAGAQIKRTMRDSSVSMVLAVDSSKLGGSAPARAIELSMVDVMVTDLDPSDHRLDEYRERVELL